MELDIISWRIEVVSLWVFPFSLHFGFAERKRKEREDISIVVLISKGLCEITLCMCVLERGEKGLDITWTMGLAITAREESSWGQALKVEIKDFCTIFVVERKIIQIDYHNIHGYQF